MGKFLLTFLFFVLCYSKKDYSGFKVVSVSVSSEQEINLLEKILNNALETDIWSNEGILVQGENHIRMTNSTLSLVNHHFASKILIEDVQKLIDSSEPEKDEAFFDNYRRYAEIVTELQNWNKKYPTLTKLIPSIGKSVEGRDIPAISISALGFTNTSIQRIFFQGGQHAREWIGPAVVLYLVSQLLEKYGEDAIVTKLLDSMEFVIVPLVNPDGYEYAHTNERLWRKNRKKNTGGSFGVDLNRNWNDHWGGAGSSGIPTSDTYRGVSAFSEPESLHVSNFITSMDTEGNILAAIDFHSYSQLVLRPYGWTTANCPDNQALKILGDGISYEIQRNSAKRYTSQRSIDLYITTGSASDWFYQEGIWGAYTIELRDTGAYGFVLPPAQIIPTGNEIWASMMYFVNAVFDTHP